MELIARTFAETGVKDLGIKYLNYFASINKRKIS